MNDIKIKRALLSVSDKTGISEFAQGLVSFGIEILSTGKTAKQLRKDGIPVVEIEQWTAFPEMMDGRLKTLHPKVHGGILARRDRPEHRRALEQLQGAEIDLVCVNLYPFEETVRRPGVSLEEAVENIDIGGPAMIRAAAKNNEWVCVVVSPERYGEILDELRKNSGKISLELRRRLAMEAFGHTALYDADIHRYFHGCFAADEWPAVWVEGAPFQRRLRYGENPHQRAALYAPENSFWRAIRQIQGKELSFNNLLDAEACWSFLQNVSEKPFCVIVKHTNPCGFACGEKTQEAFLKAVDCDERAAFGGIVGLNRKLSLDVADVLLEKLPFFEVLLVPGVEEEAAKRLFERKNLRVLIYPDTGEWISKWEIRPIRDAYLVQTADQSETLEELDVKIMTPEKPSEEEWKNLNLGWRCIRAIKSNAVLVLRGEAAVGIGCGQTSRVGALENALRQAGEKAKGAVMVSEALLPFRDSVDLCAQYGIRAVLETGGSVRDAEVIQAAREHRMALLFTGVRHFKH